MTLEIFKSRTTVVRKINKYSSSSLCDDTWRFNNSKTSSWFAKDVTVCDCWALLCHRTGRRKSMTDNRSTRENQKRYPKEFFRPLRNSKYSNYRCKSHTVLISIELLRYVIIG